MISANPIFFAHSKPSFDASDRRAQMSIRTLYHTVFKSKNSRSAAFNTIFGKTGGFVSNQWGGRHWTGAEGRSKQVKSRSSNVACAYVRILNKLERHINYKS